MVRTSAVGTNDFHGAKKSGTRERVEAEKQGGRWEREENATLCGERRENGGVAAKKRDNGSEGAEREKRKWDARDIKEEGGRDTLAVAAHDGVWRTGERGYKREREEFPPPLRRSGCLRRGENV